MDMIKTHCIYIYEILKKKIKCFKPRKMKEANNKKIKCYLRIPLAAVKLSQLARMKPQ